MVKLTPLSEQVLRRNFARIHWKAIKSKPKYFKETYLTEAIALINSKKLADAIKIYKKLVKSIALFKEISCEYIFQITQNFSTDFFDKKVLLLKPFCPKIEENLYTFIFYLFERGDCENNFENWIAEIQKEKDLLKEYKTLLERLHKLVTNWAENKPIKHAYMYETIRKVQKGEESLFNFFKELYFNHCDHKTFETKAVIDLIKENCEKSDVTNATFEQTSKCFVEQIDFIVSEFEGRQAQSPEEIESLWDFVDKVNSFKGKFEEFAQCNILMFNSLLRDDELIGQYHEDFPKISINPIDIFLNTFSICIEEKLEILKRYEQH